MNQHVTAQFGVAARASGPLAKKLEAMANPPKPKRAAPKREKTMEELEAEARALIKQLNVIEAKIGKSLMASTRMAHEILHEYAEKSGYTAREILGPTLRIGPVKVRHELMYVLRVEKNWSYPQIGRFLGGRDHNTIWKGVRSHCKRMGLRVPDTGSMEYVRPADDAEKE